MISLEVIEVVAIQTAVAIEVKAFRAALARQEAESFLLGTSADTETSPPITSSPP